MLSDNVVFVPSLSVTQPESEASTMVTVEVVGAVAVAEELAEAALVPALALIQLAAEDEDVSWSCDVAGAGAITRRRLRGRW